MLELKGKYVGNTESNLVHLDDSHNESLISEHQSPETNQKVFDQDSSELIVNLNSDNEEELLREKKITSEEKYAVKSGCDDKCKKKCLRTFDEQNRRSINLQYWSLDSKGRRFLIQNLLSITEVQRRTCSTVSRRLNTVKYRLKDVNGEFVEVCKTFFLATLGYDRKNDAIIKCLMPKNEIIPKYDKRRRFAKSLDKETIRSFIETFNPAVSHYRRKHAPNKR